MSADHVLLYIEVLFECVRVSYSSLYICFGASLFSSLVCEPADIHVACVVKCSVS